MNKRQIEDEEVKQARKSQDEKYYASLANQQYNGKYMPSMR
jgi:hypothetical protein